MKRSTTEVVQKAREYLGTPFQHQGRLKGIALDCVGLPLCVAEDLGLVDSKGVPFRRTDNANYTAQPLDAFVHREAVRRLIQKDIADIAPGDLITLRVPRVPCHVAIVSAVSNAFGLGMIHAYSGYATKKLPNGSTVEHILDEKWMRRIEGVFSFPGVTNG